MQGRTRKKPAMQLLNIQLDGMALFLRRKTQTLSIFTIMSERVQVRRRGSSCFLPENPGLQILPVRIGLASKLPPSLMGVGNAALFLRQRHSQQPGLGA